LGHVLDEKGEKMSKSKGNIIDPWHIVEKYSADAVRWSFYTVNQPGATKLFSEKEPENALRKFILPLWNSCLFLKTYSHFQPLISKKPFSKHILDRWIISKLNELILKTTKLLENYDITGAARSIEKFVMNELSLWYIRRSRKRFQQPENEKELKNASETLGFVIFKTIKLSAPFVPFLAEHIYQDFKNMGIKTKESIHLEDWPKATQKSINQQLNKEMEKVREVVVQALAQRAKAQIKVRQVLQELVIKDKELKNKKGLLDLIKQEVNVKKISFGKELKLNTELTNALKEEGMIREVIRNLQQMRKKQNLTPKDIILIEFKTNTELEELLLKNKEKIIKETRAKDLVKKKAMKKMAEININSYKLRILIKKIKT